VVCTSLDMAGPVAESLSEKLPELDVQPWQEFAEEFYRAMQADMQGLWISIFIVVLVASASVLNTVLMSVLERRREYGVLRAIGTPPRTIVSMIMLEALIQAAVAIAVGLVVSTIALDILSSHGMSFSEPLTYGGVRFAEMRAQITPRSLWLPAVVVAATALLVSIPPALKAARISPARAMRNV
jgi:ABC-type lipoprotein release transport system permease subunit